ncbi:MAG: alpha/beta hydrolase [Gammaproteobacteria bacterium]|nr:alpha/beta hydrolase [Gammaproteobacteria bacterium]
MTIEHRTIQTNGINMRIAEQGEGPLVVLCHGFPESWYSWRHQISALAEAGYHAVAPDQRGYGKTDKPPMIEAYSIMHLVGDIVGLVQALESDHAVVVGHDWGAPVAWNCAMMRPDIFRAVVALSVPWGPRSGYPPMQGMKQYFGDRFFYQLYFQTPGVAEHELQHDVAETMRKMLYGASGSVNRRSMLSNVSEGPHKSSYMLENIPDPQDSLPDWLTQQDIDYFVAEFEEAGFRGGLNWYRNIDHNWVLTAPFQNMKIMQPALFVTGEFDVVPYDDYAGQRMRAIVPNLRDPVVLPGTGHWTQQESPNKVNEALIGFLNSLN